MNKSLLALIVIGSLSSPLAAQPAATVSIDVFLEQRVAEELAADGTILSRLGVALDVEVVGDKLIVSLVDPATRRAVASTKVDTIPADREAAVAAVTQVAANLASQLSANASPAAAAVKAVLTDERAERAARDQAEYKYRQEAITFGNEIGVQTDGKTTTTTRTLVAYQGEEHRRLAGSDIYEALGRDDLAQRYTNRATVGWVGLFGGGAVSMVGMFVLIANVPGGGADACYDGTTGATAFDACSTAWDHDHRPYVYVGGALMTGGLVGMLVGVYYYYHRHPIDESEIYDLANQHNQGLRQKYGLPVSERRRARTQEPSLVVSPYMFGDSGGLSVAGRF